MILRPDRQRRGPDSTLLHRMALFAVGAALAITGMIWSRNILVNTALVILIAAMLLGLWGRRDRSNEHDDGDEPREGPDE